MQKPGGAGMVVSVASGVGCCSHGWAQRSAPRTPLWSTFRLLLCPFGVHMPGAFLAEKVMGFYGHLYFIKSAILHLCQTEEQPLNMTGLVLVKRHGLCPLVP